jgi:thiol-disulfide isomerase/thioredoxin
MMQTKRAFFGILLSTLCVAAICWGQAAGSREDEWLRRALAGKRDEVLKETAAALQEASSPAERAGIVFVRARAQILQPDLPAAEKTIDEFLTAAPGDERGGELLFRIAKATTEPAERKSRFARAVEKFPQSYWGKMSAGAIKQIESIGKPFALDFTDAISGRPFSLQRDAKGKVAVIFFWASWCPDCNAMTPTWKALYEKYHDRGVAFVGVSLDEPESAGGLASLKRYVDTKQIPWPQFYQGNRFDSAFSESWGVSSTPTVFLIDAAGNLASTNPQPDLESAIAGLMARRDADAKKPG